MPCALFISTTTNAVDQKDNLYKLTKKTTVKKVEKMDFNKVIELVPAQLQQGLTETFNNRDNYGKEKLLNSIKLIIKRHVKETK